MERHKESPTPEAIGFVGGENRRDGPTKVFGKAGAGITDANFDAR